MTDTNSNNNDDAEKMRLAFEQFMLSGGKNNTNNKNSQNKNSNEEVTTPQSTSSKSKKKKKKKRQSTGATPNKVVSTPPATIKQPSPQQQPTTTMPNPKIKKRYYQLLRSFNDKVKHTWMDIDEQLLSVLQNIVSIRGRVPHEWKMLSQATRYHQTMMVEDSPEQVEEEFDIDDYNGNHGDDWKSYGHQETSSQSFSHHLQIDDIQLALSHDLEQHEKMLTGLRSLMSNLAECHDALGRIVDSLWQFHFEVENNEGMMNKNERLEHIVTCVSSLYQMLSMELYKKQNMIPMVIDSTKDEIMGMNELGKGGHGVGTKKSQTLVRECCKSWKRSSSDEELLLSAMKLGES